ncbi:DUF3426 domain-containing protein [Burkholderia sp. Ac-20365]|uniref:DUF3426 domain-containing protein n=1 Tax=Burkholderia sp. Ac-20365 TaxID=2703897 RepID=UPI00197B5E57|nr:DUF3426 domain-containing protein [Burkholderia sp. Ac-20365]MBN3764854.1 DUF3426 domain-containing protein [Burkholderia sp. Ac-20365]
MLLATRCPFCETVFRLQPEQLTLRRGLVRCGHCKEVFDASSSLFDVSNGASIDKARPVTIDDVTAHTLDTLANGGVTAVREAKPVVEVPSSPSSPSSPVVERAAHAATPAADVVAEHVVEPQAGSEAAHVEEQSAAPAVQPGGEVAAAEPAPAVEAEATPAAQTQHESPANPPDFRAEEWNPWAPAPDASIDRRIRHNASTIPLKPVTIPSSAQPPLKLELTESQPMNLEKAIARKPVEAEPHSEAAVDAASEMPLVVPVAETPAEPAFEQKTEPQAHAKTEPTFDAAPAIHESQAWREPESLREPAQAHQDLSAQEAKHEPEAPLHDPFDDALRESRRDEPAKSVLDDEDRTVMPSAEHAAHAEQGERSREREPYFGAPSAEPDLEPRFGAAAREPYGEPGREDYNRPFAAAPDGDDAFAVTREPRAPEPSRIVWHILGGVAAGLLGALLLVQLAWWQRETVMVAWPDAQSLFVKACSHLGCKVEPPRDIDGLLVEPSDLRQIDGPHKLELKMPLRNRFDLALAYPAVELTLLDENNNIAVRRVLWPQDYVKPGTPIAAGLPARTTQTMVVRLDTGDAVASNFRVQIFYP